MLPSGLLYIGSLPSTWTAPHHIDMSRTTRPTATPSIMSLIVTTMTDDLYVLRIERNGWIVNISLIQLLNMVTYRIIGMDDGFFTMLTA